MGNTFSGGARFHSKTNAAEVVRFFLGDADDLEGAVVDRRWVERTLLITGCTHGIGRATVEALCRGRFCPRLILANRNAEASQRLRESLLANAERRRPKGSPPLNIECVDLDLASLDSVRRCGQDLVSRGEPLHVVVQNAGVFCDDGYLATNDGFERQFQINYLGHLLLWNIVQPLVVKSCEDERALSDGFMGRLVCVSSHSHYGASFKEHERDFPPAAANYSASSLYSGNSLYEFSKLCQVAAAAEISSQLEARKVPVRAVSLHPGALLATNISADAGSVVRGLFTVASLFTRTLEQGAATTCFTALTDNLEGGAYYDACAVVKPNPAARDRALRRTIVQKTDDLLIKWME